MSLHYSNLSYFSIKLYDMYDTREYIICFLFIVASTEIVKEWSYWYSSSLFEKPNCQYVVEEKTVLLR